MVNNTFNNRKKYSIQFFNELNLIVMENRHDTGSGMIDMSTGEVNGGENPYFGGYEIFGCDDEDFHIRCVIKDIVPQFKDEITYLLKYQIVNSEKDVKEDYEHVVKTSLEGYNRIVKNIKESV